MTITIFEDISSYMGIEIIETRDYSSYSRKMLREVAMDNAAQIYNEKAKGLLRAEIKRRNMDYEDLAEALAEMGVEGTAKNLSNKIARGSFSAGFMLMCLEAIGVKVVRLVDE
jgi:Domain of unknown function (DUF6471)